jgi:hypothetical protein
MVVPAAVVALTVTVLVAAAPPGPTASSGVVSNVAVEGRARIGAPGVPDQDSAVDAAKRDARKLAHAKAAGMVVSSATVVRNFALVSDVVSEQVRGVILDESWGAPRVDGKHVIMALKARVSPAAVAEGACTALTARHSARIAVVIARDDKPQDVAALALLDALKSGCMTATLVNTSGALIEKQVVLDDVRARSAGELALFVKPGHDGVNMTARIVDVTNNEILAVATGNAAHVADTLFQQVAKVWTKELNDGRRITFTFATTSFAAAGLVARGVAQALAVDEAKDQHLKDGVLRFSLFVPTDGVTAARKLEGLRVGERTLTVTAAEGGALTVAYKE